MTHNEWSTGFEDTKAPSVFHVDRHLKMQVMYGLDYAEAELRLSLGLTRPSCQAL